MVQKKGAKMVNISPVFARRWCKKRSQKQVKISPVFGPSRYNWGQAPEGFLEAAWFEGTFQGATGGSGAMNWRDPVFWIV